MLVTEQAADGNTCNLQGWAQHARVGELLAHRYTAVGYVAIGVGGLGVELKFHARKKVYPEDTLGSVA